MKLKKLACNSFAGPVGCVGLLALLAVVMLCPIQNKSASADEVNGEVDTTTVASEPEEIVYDEQIMTADAATPRAAATVSLTVGSTSLSGTAASTSATVSAQTDLTVTAQNTTAYNIYVQETSNNGNLVGQNGKETVAPLSSSTAYSSIPAGRWGYAITDAGHGQAASGLTYKGVPTSTTASAYSGTTASSKPFTLAFAAKFNTNQSADHYKANVLVSVAANPGEVTTLFDGITDMQEMTTDICGKAKENDTKQLIDIRDGKSYWVTKLKDQNCWMTQNLDYDSPSSTKITNPSSWTNTSATYRAYYDPGYKVVSGTALVDAGSSDTHLLVGNYYSWASATANSGNSLTTDGAIATESICPSGWRLPTSKAGGEFEILTTTYGIGNNAAGSTALRAAPFYFIFGGSVYSGNLYFAGDYGYYWSSTAYSSTGAYFLFFRSDAVYPSNTDNRYVGQSVRCLVQGS